MEGASEACPQLINGCWFKIDKDGSKLKIIAIILGEIR